MKEDEGNNEGYNPNLPRVSNLVSYKYPFKGTEGEKRYKDWLKQKGIEEDEYLDGANTLGTKVHNSLEDYILGKKIKKDKLYKEVKGLINHGIDYIDSLGADEIHTELYLTDGRMQGTCDLLFKIGDSLILADWKTYGVVKKRYGLPNKFVVATDKKKKVQLQMSIYAYLYYIKYGEEINKIQLLFLHEDGCKTVEMDIIPKEEINQLIEDYINSLSYEEFIF